MWNHRRHSALWSRVCSIPLVQVEQAFVPLYMDVLTHCGSGPGSAALGKLGESMSSFQYPDLDERQTAAAAAKKALLAKFRAKAEDPAREQVRAARAAIHQARLTREAQREAARQVRHELGRKNCFFVHVSLVPFMNASGEQKTKPDKNGRSDFLQSRIHDQEKARDDGQRNQRADVSTAQNPIVHLEHVEGSHKRQQIYEEAEDNSRCEARAKGLGRVGQKRRAFRHGD